MNKQLLELTEIWMNLIGHDHHKDRDCHFEIIERWSYGDKPKYYATHSGYINEEFFGEDRDTKEEAEIDLILFLQQIIHKEKEHQQREKENDRS